MVNLIRYLACGRRWKGKRELFINKRGCLWARQMKSRNVISYPSWQHGAYRSCVMCIKQSIMNLNSHPFKQSGVSFKWTWSL